ncbi:E3 ubiquitin-protein ligase [Aspergillus lucknowensis]|uniref:RBR-type E3 ubiquitin transferase n=1 Tax=Aspergillus lucknowensis TaxID=176173 RepID=A0ABR4M494_9EURO
MELLPAQHSQSVFEDEILALAQQLKEIECYRENEKGKYRAGTLPNVETATSTFQDEVEAYITFLSDRKLAQSIALAVDSDGEAITAIAREEIQAGNDRRLAMSIHSADLITCESPPTDDRDTCIATQPPYFDEDYQESEVAGPSMTYTQRQEEMIQKLNTKAQCCVCYDSSPVCRMIQLKNCSHIYCADCLKTLFLRATKDQSLFPPRCCREEIPLLLVEADMSEHELGEFESAAIEYTTKDRTYCSNIRCGKFIPPSRITADQAECDVCNSSTCTMCKEPYHQDDCASDPALQATLSLASREGWQRCFSCRALVQLGTGCYHMTCKCRAEFCYLCGLGWKTCSCERWNEQRLVERAQEVVDREANQALPPGDRDLRVARMQEDLRDNHECEHPGRFERIFGTGRRRFECEICGDQHRKYILQCRRCHIHACEDCRRNRL